MHNYECSLKLKRSFYANLKTLKALHESPSLVSLGLNHFQVLRSNYLLTNPIKAPLLISPTYDHWRRLVKILGGQTKILGTGPMREGSEDTLPRGPVMWQGPGWGPELCKRN